jgi:RNA polymerase sigma factor (sigma-70 family)
VKHSEQWLNDYSEMVSKLAQEYRRRYPMIEAVDIQQEMYLWFVTHPRKFKEWLSLPDKEREKLIAKSLRNAALKYCEKEKAKIIKYDLSDLYYYDTSVVEAFLPSILHETYEMPSKIKDLNSKFSGGGEFSDGMNWVALRADIANAFYQLSEAKQNILRLAFYEEHEDWKTVAKELETTPDGARMKVQRALGSLVQHLGGWKPYNDEDIQEEAGRETNGNPAESE